MVTDINSTTVRVTWEQPEMLNGIITLYTIMYTVDGVSSDFNVSHTGEVCNNYMLVCHIYVICVIAADTIL